MLKSFFKKYGAQFFSPPWAPQTLVTPLIGDLKCGVSRARAPCGCEYCREGDSTSVINANINLRLNVSVYLNVYSDLIASKKTSIKEY